MKTKITLFFVLSLIFFSCKEKSKDSFTDANTQVISCNLDALSFSNKLKSTNHAQLIDVRTPEEFESNHIPNALNVDYNNPEFENQIAKLDKTKPTFVYCLSGGRSSEAVKLMEQMGFTELYNMEGGMMKWDAMGLNNKQTNASGMSQSDFQKLIQNNNKVLIDFNAKWCGPCQRMAPYLEKLKDELKENLTIISIDVDSNTTLAGSLGIESLPTLLLYENKKVVWKNIGFISEDELRKHI
ncbi:thioredoxin domain-containing protein [Flavobacterium aciduliphilum]|jgi:thioredoxin|uniref:Thioredoxin n=1 Tax=Flavobacterium aciduliphilum TaxID=1101402 RepID=A0A328YTP9_9FLAO|nr:thioredoxin domain-containing protein [Flavobacterium aciduliphilum]RAR75572.1 thioredoxin [Flavobacterium aciduliphilum]